MAINLLFADWRRCLFLVFTLAFVLRAGVALTLQNSFYFPDSIEYSGAAISLLERGELGATYNRPPGYAVFLAAIYLLFGESILAIRMTESLLGGLLALLIAVIGKKIGGEVVGALAGILWGFYPLGVFVAGLVYPENLLTTLLAGSILCFLQYSHPPLSPKGVLLAGVLLGLAALTKPVVLATIGAVSLWVMFQPYMQRLLVVSLLFLGSAISVIPWMIRDFYHYDRVVFVEPRIARHLPRLEVAEANTPETKIQPAFKRVSMFANHFTKQFWGFWKLQPDNLIMDWPAKREAMHAENPRLVKETIFSRNALTRSVSILSTGPLFLFAAIGTAAMCLRRARRRDLILLWAVILSFALVYSLFTTRVRYRVPVEPYILILSAYGMRKTWERVRLATRGSRFEVRSSRLGQAEAKVEN